jgi:glycogen debranching enzyme
VEIQALWYNALRILASFTSDAGYSAMADRVRTTVLQRFFRADLGYLADVVDGPAGDEVELRPTTSSPSRSRMRWKVRSRQLW